MISEFSFFAIWIVLVGLCVGSFLNVCICRLPRHESLLHPPSHCPRCGHAIRPWENIPVLSYLALRGKCSGCGVRISAQYPLIEAATGGLFFLLWARTWGLQVSLGTALAWFALAPALLVVAMTDIEHGMVPNAATYPGIVAGLLLALIVPRVPAATATTVTLAPADWIPLIGQVRTADLPVRLQSALQAATGAAFGAGMLAFLREIGHLGWGRTTLRSETPFPVRISPLGLQIGDGDLRPWEQLLERKSDRIDLQLAPHTELPEALANTTPDPKTDRLRIDHECILFGGQSIDLQAVPALEFTAVRCRVPREVLGLGDIKLAAMIGAFLGVSGTLAALMLGSLSGTAWGLLTLALTRGKSGAALPFGPFLALGAIVWIFAGHELLMLCAL